jgi:glycerophosphoryl diester phosphodiesterase
MAPANPMAPMIPTGRRRLLRGLAAGGALAALPGLPALAALAAAAAPKAARLNPASKPLLFAHRGASALRPEHTLAAYAKAIADGADFVEPDLVATRDGVLVVRHENAITDTTDVAARPEFAGRKTRKVIDGEAHEGWFVSDFTFAELKQLRAIERLPKMRGTRYDGQFQIVSFEETIDFVAAEAAARGRTIGLIPELKHSTWFAAAGLPLEDRFVATLNAHAYTRTAPVEIQSFETANLQALRKRLGRDPTSNLRLMQLVVAGGDYDRVRPADVAAGGGTLTYGEMVSARGLRDMAAYADVVAPITRAVIPLGKDGRLGASTSLVADAHRAGLLVQVWTFRPENAFLAADFRDGGAPEARNEAGSIAEMRRYLETGIDGLFSDDPGLARTAIDT